MSPKLCVMQSFHREIKLGLKKSIFGSDYLWQEILSCFLFFFFFNIFLWTSLLSGAKVGNSNIEGMPKSLLEFHSSNWRMALPPFFQFFFFFFPQRISSQPSPITLFFLELLVVIWICILIFMSLSRLWNSPQQKILLSIGSDLLARAF